VIDRRTGGKERQQNMQKGQEEKDIKIEKAES